MKTYTLELTEQERNVVLDALELATNVWEPLEDDGVAVAEDLHDRITNRR